MLIMAFSKTIRYNVWHLIIYDSTVRLMLHPEIINTAFLSDVVTLPEYSTSLLSTAEGGGGQGRVRARGRGRARAVSESA